MAFSDQYAMYQELRRLKPADSHISEKGIHVWNLAVALGGSGSGLMVEMFLASLFGYHTINVALERDLRRAIEPPIDRLYCGYISLRTGSGPTVRRALEPEMSGFFATVVQCAFLSSVHEKKSLAECLIDTIAKTAESIASVQSLPSIPSQEDIVRFLEVCQEQTSSSNWAPLLDDVAKRLGAGEDTVSDPIDPSIIRGVCVMLPFAQVLRGARTVSIRTRKGLPSLVVWIFYVLGLTVEVYQDSPLMIVAFGQTHPPHVTIEAYCEQKPMIELKDSYMNVILFRLEPGPYEATKLHGFVRRPLRGIGRRILRSAWTAFVGVSQYESHEKHIQEMVYVTVAFAMNIAEHLRKGSRLLFEESSCISSDTPGSDQTIESNQDDSDDSTTEIIARRRILDTAFLIFYDKLAAQIAARPLQEFIFLCSGMALSSLPAGKKVREEAAPKLTRDKVDERWANTLRPTIGNLSVLILAFANARDLDDCSKLPLACEIGSLDDQALVRRIWGWDGKSSILLQEGDWFEIVTKLLVGPNETINSEILNRTVLLSDHGWSIFTKPLVQVDPSNIEPGTFDVKRGVPHRHHARRKYIMDPVITPLGSDTVNAGDMKTYCAGDPVPVNIEEGIKYKETICEDRRDSFVMALDIYCPFGETQLIRRTGHRELSRAVWSALRTRDCEHLAKSPVSLTLPEGCGALKVITDDNIDLLKEKLVLCLTNGNSIARWRALIALNVKRLEELEKGAAKVLLRGSGCCWECAIKQASGFAQRCYLVL